MIRLNVWLTLPSGENIKAGSLVTADPDEVRGGIEGQFRYDPAYLDHPSAFPLDPLHLPLSEELFNANRPQAGVHGGFEDSLPDDWGRRIMIRRHGLGRLEQRVPNLLRLQGNQGMGGLSYTEHGQAKQKSTGVPSRRLEELIRLADKFEREPAATEDDELSLLFQAGSSPGGVRPKALVDDEGTPYLAKLASTRDQVDVVTLEAAAMELGRRAGIETAESRLVSLASGSCLLVKRFDVTSSGGRNHLISMQSLLKADGYYNAGYRELAEIIRHVSSQPARDLQRLYLQMVFNVMIGNTDDHLKNFFMLHNEEGWRLSPVFDLVPNIGFNREHVLAIGFDNKIPDGETLLTEAKHFGIKQRQQTVDLIDSVYESVSCWEGVFLTCNVPEKDRGIIGADIRERLKKTRIRRVRP